MREIKLTKGFIALVDDEDFNKLNMLNWHVTGSKNRKYAASGKKGCLMHRFIMDTPDELIVDHIDGNTLNNQKSNLRNCTFSDNSKNSKPRKSRISPFKGISKRRFGGWRARIQLPDRRLDLGTYSQAGDAAKAYDTAAIKYFGEFAKTNFPREFYEVYPQFPYVFIDYDPTKKSGE